MALEQHLGVFITEVGRIHITGKYAEQIDITFGQRTLHSGVVTDIDFIERFIGYHFKQNSYGVNKPSSGLSSGLGFDGFYNLI